VNFQGGPDKLELLWSQAKKKKKKKRNEKKKEKIKRKKKTFEQLDQIRRFTCIKFNLPI
jgi:hypothetical protein